MNWGNRLLLVFIVFAGGMGFLVYKCLNTNYDLVETDYYATELRYQQVIDDSKRATELSTPVELTQESEVIRLQFPGEMKNKKLEGSIWFYCAYDRRNDRKMRVAADATGVQYISSQDLHPGHYSVRINWKDANSSYYTEKELKIM
jgi:hypothetical protein